MNQYLSEEELARLGLASFGQNVLLHRSLNLLNPERIRLGSNVRIDGFCVISAAGGLEIGSYVHIASFCNLACGGGVAIGNFAGLSQGVKLYSTSDDYSGRSMTNPTVPDEYKDIQVAPVTMGDHAIVGAGSVILPGTEIGEGVATSALALLRGKLEAWSIYAGAPARRVGPRSRELLDRGRELIEQVK